MINGKMFDWEDVSIGLPHGVALLIKDISYDDELEVDPAYGKGNKAVGYGTGNYKASGKMSILREEYDKFIDYAKSTGKALYRLPPFPITCSYANDGEPVSTDVLRGCKISKRSWKAAQGSKELTVDLDFTITDSIESNGLKAI
ncbi:hypothetical protein [Pelotomaculum propionicicum]|uniref:Phage-like element PBSX protein XkdM n=1 Tax=Pelotomaculum propionicicum TaxID=258475 RepID=A0A4Y7RK08_9FIRM|nr:hypothetical protein [Pelotomaculum propionicicum]TEB09141.1 hypothetical protein Pmgp_03362 [Pelotomaculum propionicicum]